MTSLSPSALRALCALLALALVGCDGGDDTDGGTDASLDGGPSIDARFFPDGTVFCDSDDDCDDGTECTNDSCGGNGTCRFQVDNAFCDDGVFCNGTEQCEPGVGCVEGSRRTCNDDDVCTIDRCDEESKMCLYSPRDLDEDGDPDWFCAGGGDCDDRDPLVSSMISEVCEDGLDNDCDETIDESDCGAPRFDTCDDPLDVSEGGFYALDTDGAAPDYSVSCRSSATRDMVTTFTLTEARSVTIEAEGDFFSVALSLRTTCTDGSSELACESGFPGVIRRRSLEPGTYFVVVAASSTGEIGLDVSFGEPIEPPPNDTCASPVDVSAGGTFMGSFVEVADDLDTECSVGSAPDLVYELSTSATQDVQISATSVSGASLSYSVRSTCADDASEVRCAYGDPATGTIHELPAGTYYVVVEGPSFRDEDFTLDVQILDPTPPADGDTCDNPIELTSGTPATGMLVDKENDEAVSCGFRYRDAIYSFTLSEASDVLLELDAGAFSNMAVRSTCDDGSSGSQLICRSGDPVLQRLRNLSAGTYYVLVESRTASGFTLDYEATSPPTVPTDVSGNDTCAGAHPIPSGGGLFRGDTTALVNDLDGTSCGGGAMSNDAVFELTLSSTQRVVMSTEGSAYDTVLHVHNGTCTSGGEVHCNDDRDGTTDTSFLDRTLAAGTWFIVVDGWGSSSSGEYELEVLVSDP
ncbi:MAG TPA: putative metal-binding motif-containing protein [Sandaracinaceae bacterium LLY-WYZ-13_1]|nr:putative metal-binding motif-containing protein [Sandaracinaceae bacterium LLY-WYZ-13_1]